MVKTFIGETQPWSEKFRDQICEVAHPNGETLMFFGGVLQERRFDPPSSESNEGRLFLALYNCLYSCRWLIGAMIDFDICSHDEEDFAGGIIISGRFEASAAWMAVAVNVVALLHRAMLAAN